LDAASLGIDDAPVHPADAAHGIQPEQGGGGDLESIGQCAIFAKFAIGGDIQVERQSRGGCHGLEADAVGSFRCALLLVGIPDQGVTAAFRQIQDGPPRSQPPPAINIVARRIQKAPVAAQAGDIDGLVDEVVAGLSVEFIDSGLTGNDRSGRLIAGVYADSLGGDVQQPEGYLRRAGGCAIQEFECVGAGAGKNDATVCRRVAGVTTTDGVALRIVNLPVGGCRAAQSIEPEQRGCIGLEHIAQGAVLAERSDRGRIQRQGLDCGRGDNLESEAVGGGWFTVGLAGIPHQVIAARLRQIVNNLIVPNVIPAADPMPQGVEQAPAASQVAQIDGVVDQAVSGVGFEA